MKPLTLLFALLIVTTILSAQVTIMGFFTDMETGDELIYANIVLTKDGVFVTGCSTDFDGRYEMRVDPGIYKMLISYTGYLDHEITDIEITEASPYILDYEMQQGIIEYCYFPIYHIVPLIEIDNTSSKQKTTNEDIRNMPTKNINEIILNTAGVSINW